MKDGPYPGRGAETPTGLERNHIRHCSPIYTLQCAPPSDPRSIHACRCGLSCTTSIQASCAPGDRQRYLRGKVPAGCTIDRERIAHTYSPSTPLKRGCRSPCAAAAQPSLAHPGTTRSQINRTKPHRGPSTVRNAGYPRYSGPLHVQTEREGNQAYFLLCTIRAGTQNRIGMRQGDRSSLCPRQTRNTRPCARISGLDLGSTFPDEHGKDVGADVEESRDVASSFAQEPVGSSGRSKRCSVVVAENTRAQAVRTSPQASGICC